MVKFSHNESVFDGCGADGCASNGVGDALDGRATMLLVSHYFSIYSLYHNDEIVVVVINFCCRVVCYAGPLSSGVWDSR
jgi:hypothetical protein